MKQSFTSFMTVVALFTFAVSSCDDAPPPPAKPAAVNAPAIDEEPEAEPWVKLSNKTCEKWLLHYGEENPETVVLIRTTLGDIKVRLYTETPIHRANFIRLAKDRYFDKTLFTRVEKGFIIQGGKSQDSYHEVLRSTYGTFSLPAEFTPHRYHKKGALAAAREYDNNPDKRSSPFDFYLVQGQVSSNKYLDHLETESGTKFTPERRAFYTQNAGSPHIDMEHTVFGEVIEGLEVIDKIAAVEVDGSKFPITDVALSVEVVD